MQKEYDDSQISLRIALSAAVYASVALLFYTIVVNSIHFFRVWVWTEIAIKSCIVVVAVLLSRAKVKEALTLWNPSSVPFLSTFFFYGITLFLLYLGQICYIAFQIFFAVKIDLMNELRFLFWLSEFSVSGIIAAFLAGHVPYMAYFLFLKGYIGSLRSRWVVTQW